MESIYSYLLSLIMTCLVRWSWRECVVKLRYSFGSAHPLLANQPSEILSLWMNGGFWPGILSLTSIIWLRNRSRRSTLSFTSPNIPLACLVWEFWHAWKADYSWPLSCSARGKTQEQVLRHLEHKARAFPRHARMESDTLDDHVVALLVHVHTFYCC